MTQGEVAHRIESRFFCVRDEPAISLFSKRSPAGEWKIEKVELVPGNVIIHLTGPGPIDHNYQQRIVLGHDQYVHIGSPKPGGNLDVKVQITGL